MTDSQGSNSSEEIVNTNDNLISPPCLITKLVDAFSVSNFLPSILTLRLPIICALPERLGYFSCRVNPNGGSDIYYPDKSCLPYLRPDYFTFKNINLLENVSEQFSFSYRIPVETGHILQWIQNSPDRGLRSNFNFICTTSRVLRSILNVPYNDGVYWTTIAIKLGSTIYLFFRDPNTRSRADEFLNTAKVKSTITGLRFSETITVKPKEMRQQFNLNGNQNSFYTVNQLEIGKHKILYPCQVDCTIDHGEYAKPYQEMKFAQIKSRSCQWSILQKENHQMVKTIAWWIGSFLSDSETIVCGERSKSFTIRDVTTFRSDSLLHVQSANINWTPKKCLDHLDAILTFIGSKVDEEKVVYTFKWNRIEQQIRYYKCSTPISKFFPYYYLRDLI